METQKTSQYVKPKLPKAPPVPVTSPNESNVPQLLQDVGHAGVSSLKGFFEGLFKGPHARNYYEMERDRLRKNRGLPPARRYNNRNWLQRLFG